MKRFSYILLLIGTFILCVWIASFARPSSQSIVLNVGAGGIFRTALQEINQVYQKEQPNVVVSYTFTASRSLQSAAERGEPFDILLFSSVAPIDKLQSDGIIIPESRRKLLTTDVVLIAPANSKLSISDFKDLTSDRIRKIAIGTNRLAIGKYTQEILSNLGIYQQIQPKAVWANVDVREILRAVENGEVDVGITFLPEAKISSTVKVVAIASREFYQPITAIAAIRRSSPHIQEATAFLDFLTTSKAVAIFEKLGIKPLQ